MLRSRHLVASLAAFLAVALSAGIAMAFWSTSSSGVSVTAAASTLGAPTLGTPSAISPANVTITVTAAGTGPTPSGYRVARTGPAGNVASAVCNIIGSTGSCNDPSPTPGQVNSYSVYPKLAGAGWEGLTPATTTASVPASVSVTTTALSDATVNGAYSQQLAASGGTTPYTWTKTSGSLPTGVSLSPGGLLSATSVTGAPATYSFTVQVQENGGSTATANLSIKLNAAPSITTTTLPAGTQTAAYNQQITSTGGTSPFTWSVVAGQGSLPTGLSLGSSTGVISGTLAANATSTSFQVRLSDANGVTSTQSLSTTVNTPPAITQTSLPGGVVNTAYSQTLSVTGGTTPITWALQSGTLPTGVSFSNGSFSGTATAIGSYSFTIKATDANAVAVSQAYTVVIEASAPSISTTSLANGTANSAYNQSVSATGGSGTYTFSITSGSLPAGLSINPNNGAISGTPTAAGSSTFTVTATDTNSVTGSKQLTITVVPATPGTPALLASDDSGTSNSDNITKVTTPHFTGTVTANATVAVFSDGAQVGTGSANGSGAYSIQVSTLTSGQHTITVKQTVSSLTSAVSNGLVVQIDTSAPTVTVNQASGQSDPANTLPVHFTAVFSENVGAPSANSVTVGGTAGHANATVTISSTNSTTYDIAVGGLTTDGTVTAILAAGATTDTAGNNSAASSSTDNTVTRDTTAPTVPTSVGLKNGGGSGSSYINISNQSATQFNVAWGASSANSASDVIKVTLTTSGGGTVSGTAVRGASSPTVVTVDTTAGTLGEGVVTATATATDAALNSSAGVSNAATINRDITAPTVAIAFPTGNVSGSTNWNAGCSTSSTGDICGTNSDALSGIDTTKTTTNIQKDGGATACQQAGQPSHFNQACPSTIAVDTASATAWNKLFTYTTGSFAITVSVSDLAGNTATASTTITIS